MIRGIVNARREAVLSLRVRGAGGVELDVDAVVDTGYNASLTLPAAIVAALNLVRRSSSRAMLADGSIRRFDTYAAEVNWGGSWRMVAVSALGDEVLIGMQLLAGHRIQIDVVSGGVVEVIPLP